MDQRVEPWALEVLKALQALDATAHIAGGYLRDRDNDRPVKDLDIFLIGKLFPANDITKCLRRLGFDVVGNSVTEEYGGWNPKVLDAVEFVGHERFYPVNVIRVDGMLGIWDNLGHFDLGLCQIAHDGTDLFRTYSYMHDTAMQYMTLRSCESGAQFARSRARYERINEKYGWPLVVPAEFEKFSPQSTDELFL